MNIAFTPLFSYEEQNDIRVMFCPLSTLVLAEVEVFGRNIDQDSNSSRFVPSESVLTTKLVFGDEHAQVLEFLAVQFATNLFTSSPVARPPNQAAYFCL
jgi:hypothetical protein